MKRSWIAGVCLWAFTISFLGAEEVKIGLRPVPPYVIPDTAGGYTGLEYEIIKEALAVKGHTLKVETMPLARLVELFKSGALQAAAPILPSTNSGGTLSTSYLTYNNVAMALESSNLNLKTLADLKDKSIVAFQTANKALGPDFAKAVEGNSQYREEAQQITQIRLLYSNRVQLVVGESRILNYFRKSPEIGVSTAAPVKEFPIFPPTNYTVAFRDAKLAEDFNAGLAAIKASGLYDRLIAKYK